MFPSRQALPTSLIARRALPTMKVEVLLYVFQEHFYTPYTEIVVNGQKKKITPHGHIEERLKTVRKFEGVRVRLP
jgi:hypothetical protein